MKINKQSYLKIWDRLPDNKIVATNRKWELIIIKYPTKYY